MITSVGTQPPIYVAVGTPEILTATACFLRRDTERGVVLDCIKPPDHMFGGA